MVKIGSGAVSWSSKLQSIVALSTTEAEYIAAVSAGKEIRWMRNLLHEMGFLSTGPSMLRIDNQSAISVAKHPEHHGRIKQLDLSWYWLRDVVHKELIAPTFVPTADQIHNNNCALTVISKCDLNKSISHQSQLSQQSLSSS